MAVGSLTKVYASSSPGLTASTDIPPLHLNNTSFSTQLLLSLIHYCVFVNMLFSYRTSMSCCCFCCHCSCLAVVVIAAGSVVLVACLLTLLLLWLLLQGGRTVSARCSAASSASYRALCLLVSFCAVALQVNGISALTRDSVA